MQDNSKVYLGSRNTEIKKRCFGGDIAMPFKEQPCLTTVALGDADDVYNQVIDICQKQSIIII